MIDRWNSVVGTWATSPFVNGPERVASLVKALHGRKHLITGNNDDAPVKGCDGWENPAVCRGECRWHASSCATIPSGPGGIWAKVGPTSMAIVTADRASLTLGSRLGISDLCSSQKWLVGSMKAGIRGSA